MICILNVLSSRAYHRVASPQPDPDSPVHRLDKENYVWYRKEPTWLQMRIRVLGRSGWPWWVDGCKSGPNAIMVYRVRLWTIYLVGRTANISKLITSHSLVSLPCSSHIFWHLLCLGMSGLDSPDIHQFADAVHRWAGVYIKTCNPIHLKWSGTKRNLLYFINKHWSDIEYIFLNNMQEK